MHGSWLAPPLRYRKVSLSTCGGQVCGTVTAFVAEYMHADILAEREQCGRYKRAAGIEDEQIQIMVACMNLHSLCLPSVTRLAQLHGLSTELHVCHVLGVLDLFVFHSGIS